MISFRFYFYNLSCFVIFSLLITSCANELLEPKREVDMLMPIAKGELNVFSLIGDSILKEKGDGTLMLVVEDDLYSFGLDSFLTLDVQPFLRNAKLSSLELGNQSFIYRIKLGQVNPAVKLFHGFSLPLPDIASQSFGPIDYNANEYFKTATFESGSVDISINNQFPVDLENIKFRVSSKSGGDFINETISSIPKKTIYKASFPLANKTLDGNFEIFIDNMDVKNSGGKAVKIDSNDYVEAEILLKDPKVKSATAVFPAQNIIDDRSDVPLEGLGDILLTEAVVENGSLDIKILSTIEDAIFFTYSIPQAFRNAEPFFYEAKLAPAPLNGSVSKDTSLSFESYKLDLRGKNGDNYNHFDNHVIGRIDSSGKIVALSLKDSVDMEIRIKSFDAGYVKGFLGRDTLKIGPEKVAFAPLEGLYEGELKVNGVVVNLAVTNGLGVDGLVKLLKLEAINTKTSERKMLSGSVLNNAIKVERAKDNPFQSTQKSIVLNEQNSNINALLDVNPDQLEYEAEIIINPNGNDGSYSDFAYSDKNLDVKITTEIPLNISAKRVIMRDTSFIDLSSIGDFEKINQGILNFIIYNQYPLRGSLRTYFLDEMGKEILKFDFTNQVFEAGVVQLSGRVEEAIRSKLPQSINKAELSALRNAKNVVFEVQFDSEPVGEYLKIYKDYKLEITISADFGYQF